MVDNHAPAANLVVSAQFTAVPATAPTQPVTIGANVVVDATASTDPDGDPVTVSFSLEQRPRRRAAALTLGAKRRASSPTSWARTAQGSWGGPLGAAFESVYTFDANNRAPNPVVVASAGAATLDAGGNSMQASVGYDLLLNGSSTDADGDAIASAWQLTARPAGSAVTLSSATGASTAFTPDVLGDYVVTLTATDTKGAKSTFTTTVHVNNRRPVANISTTPRRTRCPAYRTSWCLWEPRSPCAATPAAMPTAIRSPTSGRSKDGLRAAPPPCRRAACRPRPSRLTRRAPTSSVCGSLTARAPTRSGPSAWMSARTRLWPSWIAAA